MTHFELIRLLNSLPNYSDRHTLPPMDMGFLTHVRLKVADSGYLSEQEQQRLIEIAQGYTEA